VLTSAAMAEILLIGLFAFSRIGRLAASLRPLQVAAELWPP
jgi:hypothetical protein